LVSFLFAVLLLTVPPPRAQPFVKVGDGTHVPHSYRVGGSSYIVKYRHLGTIF